MASNFFSRASFSVAVFLINRSFSPASNKVCLGSLKSDMACLVEKRLDFMTSRARGG